MAKSKLLFHGDDSITVKYKSVPLVDIATALSKMGSTIFLDTETNVTESILDRQLKVISFTDDKAEVIVVLQWEFLSHGNQQNLLKALALRTVVMHNASFDVSILQKQGVDFPKIKCTYLAEMILTNGYSSESGFHGLQAIVKRRFDQDVSKGAQLTFSEGPYDSEQIAYAAIDVIYLPRIYEQQIQEMKNTDAKISQKGNRGMIKTNWWENEFAKVVIDMETQGILIDKDLWYKGEDELTPIHEEELKNLNDILLTEFREQVIELGHLSEEDTFEGNIWTSSAKKYTILSEAFPDIEKTSKAELKKYLRDFDPHFPDELIKSLNGKKWNAHEYPTRYDSKYAVLKFIINRDKTNEEEMDQYLNGFAKANFRDLLIREGWMIPAGKLTLNWASPVQRLAIFRLVDESIESTGKDVIIEYADKHKMFYHYLDWAAADYSIKMYGKSFYDKHVDLDGRFRTRFRQILKTGRLGSVNPNLLGIPNTKAHRSSVVAREGFKILNSDYSSQEVVVTATLAGQQNWLDAVKYGWDLHSINAERVFKEAWVMGAEDDCEFYALDDKGNQKYHKCKCPKHQKMRQDVKAVVFLYFFGGSKFKLSFQLKITEDEAEIILESFKAAVPQIETMMQKFRNYGVANGHILNSVFGRIRFFDKWKMITPEEHPGIMRQSQNTPIQSGASDILKIATVLLRRAIRHRGLVGKIYLILTVHDELLVEVMDGYEDVAIELVEHNMKLGAKLAGFNIGAEAVIGNSWYEAH